MFHQTDPLDSGLLVPAQPDNNQWWMKLNQWKLMAGEISALKERSGSLSEHQQSHLTLSGSLRSFWMRQQMFSSAAAGDNGRWREKVVKKWAGNTKSVVGLKILYNKMNMSRKSELVWKYGVKIVQLLFQENICSVNKNK